MARRTLPVLLALSLLVLFAGPPRPTQAGGGGHPYFSDGDTLVWYESMAEAREAARAEGKVIFMESGRRACGSCRQLISQVLPDPRVSARLGRIAVGLAVNCDRPDPEAQRLLSRNLPRARMLPLVAFLTADGAWITGFSGSGGVERLLAHLRKAEARVPARGPVTPAPAPRVRPLPPTPPAPRPQSRPPVAPKGAGESLAGRKTPAPRTPPQPAACGEAPPPRIGGRLGGVALSPPPPNGSACGVPRASPARTGPLPKPRIVIRPPVKVEEHARTPARGPMLARAPRPTPPPAARHDVELRSFNPNGAHSPRTRARGGGRSRPGAGRCPHRSGLTAA
ncbi:MAG: thioredoxin family protein, partial [Planctomycetota bacterium]